MIDRISKEARSRNMSRIRSTGMKPEITVRKIAHRLGYRFRLHRPDLSGKPDLVFASRKKIIFVHGCFWHQHPDSTCRIAHTPRSNTDYWIPKLQRNIERDKENRLALEELGWKVFEIWECQTRDIQGLQSIIRNILE